MAPQPGEATSARPAPAAAEREAEARAPDTRPSRAAELKAELKTAEAQSKANDKTGKVVRMLTIVLDPGHGGEDPGATGANGVREKDIVLASPSA
jgi:N-acetylmuramoyl-L-alanine amidase